MKLSLDLEFDDETARALEKCCRRRGLSKEAIAQAGIVELLIGWGEMETIEYDNIDAESFDEDVRRYPVRRR